MSRNIHSSRYIQKKVGWAREALDAYPAGDPADPVITLVDLFGDLMHLAEDMGEDAHALLDLAATHFHCDGGAGHEPDDIALANVDDTFRLPGDGWDASSISD